MRLLCISAVLLLIATSATGATSGATGTPCSRYDAGFTVEQQATNSGTRQHPRPQMIDWWYPTLHGTAAPINYGMGRGMVAEEGKLVPGTYPLVLLSHGAMGAARNYSWLAEHLACNGFLVAGGSFNPEMMAAYCSAAISAEDKGCEYARIDNPLPARTPLNRTTQRLRLPAIKAFVALDPALGPGITAPAPGPNAPKWLVVGAMSNDFLPAEHHALAIARQLPTASRLWLNNNEGHFVFLNRCALQLEANGVALCTDRPGVSRKAVHQTLKSAIQTFLHHALQSEQNAR